MRKIRDCLDDEPTVEPTTTTTSEASSVISEALLQQLMDMGFSVEGCKKALIHTGNNNIEAAMNWVFEHQSDPDFDTPYDIPASISTASEPNEENVGMILSMGFSRAHAIRALSMTNNNLEAAIDWATNNPDDHSTIHTLADAIPPAPSSRQSSKITHFRDGPGKYRLVAFISHIGNQTSCGHYVAHILKDGRWVIFNDETVALSEHPPKDLAYLYLYKRTAAC